MDFKSVNFVYLKKYADLRQFVMYRINDYLYHVGSKILFLSMI